MKKKHKDCLGCGDKFFTFKNYDYCKGCEINDSRYLNQKSPCSECDGSGMIKFRNQKPRPCRLCVLTKQNMNQKRTKKAPKLTAEEQLELNETNFWKEVEVRSKDSIANLIERNLPISAIPSVFDLEKDVEYRMILRDYTPQNYADNEDYLEKITNQSWTEEDVEYVAQEVTLWYFQSVLKGIITDLSDYACFEPSFFENLTTNEY